jgi:hypothetical protein
VYARLGKIIDAKAKALAGEPVTLKGINKDYISKNQP